MRLLQTRWVIGIDEAGRGPLAGPLVVAGVRVSPRLARRLFPDGKIRDSKQLSPKQREKWFEFLISHPRIFWAVARISPAVIDRMNIARAANFGVRRVYKKLGAAAACVCLDGSLKLPDRIPHEVIIKGDEKEPAIAAASIIAKVARDRIMLRLHKKYPQYGFDRHKGYGTKMHREMILRFGRSEVHRISFRI